MYIVTPTNNPARIPNNNVKLNILVAFSLSLLKYSATNLEAVIDRPKPAKVENIMTVSLINPKAP